tara:strand:+ start:307 stop:1620 length:1314 start_codon:yes stop_codon:yes gene_type:complete
MASTYLNRTLAANNEKKLTISVWVKINKVQEQMIVNSYYSGTYWGSLYFGSDGTLRFDDYRTSYLLKLRSTDKYNDIGSWYHIVANFDCSIGSPTAKLYVNGSEVTYLSQTIYSQNATTSWNTDYDFQVGKGTDLGGNQFDGVMSDLYFIQGYTYDASTFGEFDSTSGEWTPLPSPTINYSGTGGNSCHLKFEDSTNLDLDSGDNSVSLTTTGTPTQTLDCPSNNFSVLNNDTYHFTNQWQANTNGGTTANGGSGSAWKTILPTLGDSSGKYYFEAKLISSGSNCIIGAVDIDNQKQNSSSSWYIGQDSTGQGYQNNGTASNGGASYGTSYVNNDIIGVAMDLDNSKIYFSKNGTWQESGDPTSGASGTGALSLTANTTYTFALSSYAGTVWNCNFGNGYFATTAVTSAGTSASTPGTFEYDVPTGYQPLTTRGLNV